ncbi:MAG: hypothetical protein ABL936_13995 [Aestuariivirga sp.]
MKFFTKEWLSGEHDDEEPYAAYSRYQAHLNTIRNSFTAVLETLFSYRLHDGLVKVVNRRIPENELFVTLVIGDLQVGYQRLDLTYRNAELTQSDLEMLVRASRTENIEILEDEWDLSVLRKFTHRLIFSIRQEIEIAFDEINYQAFPLVDRKL